MSVKLSPPHFPLTENDSQGFTDTYLEAIAKQREAQRSVGSDAADIFQQPLPYEIYIHIFSYLSAKDVCRAMRVCKVRYIYMYILECVHPVHVCTCTL